MNSRKHRLVVAAGLFSSAGTLVCCALPALLVSLGFGATLAGLISALPSLVLLSEYKGVVFSGSAALLIIGGFSQRVAARQPCPLDPVAARWCQRYRHISRGIYLLSVGIWLIGFFFAFIASRLL